MNAYGILFLLLIKKLKAAYPGITQPWYAYDAGALSMFDNIGFYFNSLKLFGLGRGCYPEPLKIIIITHLYNIAARKELGLHHKFKVCTGAHYLGGFIGDD